MKIIGSILIFLLIACTTKTGSTKIVTGAEQTDKYFALLKDKKVGLVVNHTALVLNQHLVDLLLENNVQVEKIFAPEHGFRGNASAGETIKNGLDSKTGIPVISLYGKVKKPTPEHLENLDIIVFDIQDVGCRFYTYISTLHLVIEACAENDIPLLILDRPNPNGDYIAGPVLNPDFRSFVGMDPIPIVHGCTIGELALMINQEKWHKAEKKCKINVITVDGYTHSKEYELPVKPSPNLPNYTAVRLYPSLCFFEATNVSIGRGTGFPFQVIGGVIPELGAFTFIPKSIPGAAIHPKNENILCYGLDLRTLEKIPKFTLKYFIDFYNLFENKADFLNRESWFNLLAGNSELIQQIKKGNSETDIIQSWESDLNEYRKVRKKYLLYPDFE